MSETFDSPCKYLKSSQKCRFHLDGRIFSFCNGTCSDVFLAGKYQVRWKSQENFRYFGLERPNWNCFFYYFRLPEGDTSTKVCYVKYDDSVSSGIALHLTNTVFIDRALIIVPVMDGNYMQFIYLEQTWILWQLT